MLFGTADVGAGAGLATSAAAERREALETAEEKAGEPKPDWLRIDRLGAMPMLESGNETLDELGLAGCWRIEGARLDTGVEKGSLRTDPAVFGRVSVPVERAVAGRASRSLILLELASDMVKERKGASQKRKGYSGCEGGRVL